MTYSGMDQTSMGHGFVQKLARFYERNRIGKQLQEGLCLLDAAVSHESNTAYHPYDSRMERPFSPPLLSRSRASTPSLTLTRASSDEQWRYGLFQHLENETSIRIPPYRVVISPSTGTEVVIEDPISGEGVKTLGEVWNTLDVRLKYRAVVQLREMLKALRSIKPEEIPQRPIIADRYISRPGTNPKNQKRVYKNNAEFVHILKDSVGAVAYDDDLVRSAVEFVDELTMSRCELVFTHGNLTADNIYVSEWTGDILAIVNWSEAGYYPVYWEFVKAKLSYNDEPYFDRDGAVEMILKPWRIELALMKPAHEMMY
ncbi:uncharacterized protein ColSpa_04355 [Colletotrichum spaethianum]|uniref:Aminoglycoside phosphotransferase domain-containing protein n=1 Tax=Colletotrichum spaethianum TaxID=700344 RepID=A0AA37LCS5_9PEZI|nr:uncharacterized protein ColSpa_04355 [Colletotrichum spaethianum]GKT44174.1 hypothetical protein ColSpa_04355 [Colletotrichum spaethianum]